MKRILSFGFVPLLALVVLLGVTGFAAVQPPEPASTAMDQPPPHPSLPELQGVPPAELFDHFRGAQFTITDAQGNEAVYQMTPGTVSGVSTTGGTTTVSVTPNGQTAPVTFTITPNTSVHAVPGPGSLQALAQGDKVVVLTKQGSTDAVAIMKHQPRGMFRFHGAMGGFGMP